MAMNISLTSGMRNNLTALQGTVEMLNRTQDRMSSGKKVNSAIDNPTSFFAAQALSSRASDLATLKDNMGQAVQTIKAGDAGISAITTLVEAAKGLAQSALASSETTTRGAYADQFDSIMDQIDNLAADSGYKGTNLINGDDLTVTFNEDGSNTFEVSGSTLTAASGLAITDAGSLWENATITTGTAAIQTSLDELTAATTELREASSTLSSGLSIITARQDFTTAMVNTLNTGADNLTLADMNEEGANMLMLQTRQSLSTTALSLSAQAAQSVLRLFG